MSLSPVAAELADRMAELDDRLAIFPHSPVRRWLAARMGVDVSMISMWLSGRRTPTDIDAVARELGLRMGREDVARRDAETQADAGSSNPGRQDRPADSATPRETGGMA